MIIKKHPKFDEFFDGISDETVRSSVTARITRLIAGNAGDCAPVGEGVWELRIHLGSGWRIYYMKAGADIIVLLGGGSKSDQQHDITASIARARGLKSKK
jgi:putative addiction module killer protein